jgi:hypothetical protein
LRHLALRDLVDRDGGATGLEDQRGHSIVLPTLHHQAGDDVELQHVGLPLSPVDQENSAIGEDACALLAQQTALDQHVDPLVVLEQRAEDAK